jgi:two-component system nitrogen regulation response regulator NtrX
VERREDPRSLVLVVDDERGVRESLRFLLEPHFRVHAVTNGEAAVAVLREQHVSVVLLDLTMPGLSGVETLARMREIDEDVEVVIVTGYGSSRDTQEAERLRAFDFVTKPLDAARLLATVRRAEQSHRQRRPAAGEERAASRRP